MNTLNYSFSKDYRLSLHVHRDMVPAGFRVYRIIDFTEPIENCMFLFENDHITISIPRVMLTDFPNGLIFPNSKFSDEFNYLRLLRFGEKPQVNLRQSGNPTALK